MNIKEEMKARGASDQQLNSKTAELAEDIIAEASDEEVKRFGMETVRKATNNLSRNLDRAEALSASMQKLISDSMKISAEMNEAVIPSDETAQTIYLFRSMLENVHDVFGEDNMTEEVICKAIEAASYGVWRNIMGESKPLVSPIKRY